MPSWETPEDAMKRVTSQIGMDSRKFEAETPEANETIRQYNRAGRDMDNTYPGTIGGHDRVGDPTNYGR